MNNNIEQYHREKEKYKVEAACSDSRKLFLWVLHYSHTDVIRGAAGYLHTS